MNNFVLLEATTEAATNPALQWIVLFGQIALLGLVFYFILIRPQKK